MFGLYLCSCRTFPNPHNKIKNNFPWMNAIILWWSNVRELQVCWCLTLLPWGHNQDLVQNGKTWLIYLPGKKTRQSSILHMAMVRSSLFTLVLVSSHDLSICYCIHKLCIQKTKFQTYKGSVYMVHTSITSIRLS